MKQVEGEHCQQCGRSDEANQYNEGYSSCCNERIVTPPCRDDCYHDDTEDAGAPPTEVK